MALGLGYVVHLAVTGYSPPVSMLKDDLEIKNRAAFHAHRELPRTMESVS